MKDSYKSFLKTKDLAIVNSGFNIDPHEITNKLFDFQKAIVRWALQKGKAACFLDTGLGKTIVQLEWSRHIHKKEKKPVLVLAPLAVAEQTIEEGLKFGIKVNLCHSHDDVINGINITNYEKLHKFNVRDFIGVVLDESSCLKHFESKYRTLIIDSFIHTKYKLACTATPAPNDFVELGNHAEFLNIMTRPEMLAMFFINDTSKTGTWRLKGHVKDNLFWKWMSSWAVMIAKPSDIGFEDHNFILPKIHYIEHIIKTDKKPNDGYLFPQMASDLNERRKIRKETIKDRCKLAKEIIDDSNGDSFVVWCGLNDESKFLHSIINDSVEITGSQSNDIKIKSILDFAHGRTKKVITKSKITGFGVNWQICNNAIFVGLNDSWESLYQSIRRIWRFGQEKETNIHIIIEEREGSVLANLKRKDIQAKQMQENMIIHMSDFMKREVMQTKNEKTEYNPIIKMEVPQWLKKKT
ncbi:MAG: helicase [Desulfobacteraceae bacterium]|nr:helicase [Desulfobacteraceae bacterium]